MDEGMDEGRVEYLWISFRMDEREFRSYVKFVNEPIAMHVVICCVRSYHNISIAHSSKNATALIEAFLLS